jgi:hypothetical protein
MNLAIFDCAKLGSDNSERLSVPTKPFSDSEDEENSYKEAS